MNYKNIIREYKNQITVIVSVGILVGGYIVVDYGKINEVRRKEEEARKEQAIANTNYSFCVRLAENKYWEYMKLNGTENKTTGTVTASDKFWDSAAANKKAALDQCYKQYKQ